MTFMQTTFMQQASSDAAVALDVACQSPVAFVRICRHTSSPCTWIVPLAWGCTARVWRSALLWRLQSARALSRGTPSHTMRRCSFNSTDLGCSAVQAPLPWLHHAHTSPQQHVLVERTALVATMTGVHHIDPKGKTRTSWRTVQGTAARYR